MAGAFRMALSRAQVTITPPGGGAAEVLTEVTATVRDGQAKARKYARDLATMPAAELTRHNSTHFTVVGPDGTTWDVLKDCGCSGAR